MDNIAQEIKDVWRNLERLHGDLVELSTKLADAPTRADQERLCQEIDDVRIELDNIKVTQAEYVKENHLLEMKILEIRTMLEYIKTNQSKILSDMSRITWIIVGGFVSALVAYVVGGGLL